MTWLDAVIPAVLTLLVVAGWRRGAVSGVASVLGLAAGMAVALPLAQAVFGDGASSDSLWAPAVAPLVALPVALLVSMLAGRLGSALSRRLRRSPLRMADAVLGGVLSLVTGLAAVWIVGIAAVTLPGAPALRDAARRSLVMGSLTEAMPPAETVLASIARFDHLPDIAVPTSVAGAPDLSRARTAAVRRAAGSVVKVRDSACGSELVGSGWVAADGLVVTNAHVVAGGSDPRVLVGSRGRTLGATLVHIDTRNDLAILRVEDLDLHPLKLARAGGDGTSGAVIGFPGGGRLKVAPARMGATVTTVADDALGEHTVRRTINTLRARVRPGSSGGPVVDARGRVLSVVFAEATDRRADGDLAYGVPARIVREALARPVRPVGSGHCSS